MSAPSTLKQQARDVIARKLGVCPFCMRASALGAIAGWGVFALLSFFTAHPLLLIPALVIALAMSVLIAAHLAAYMARSAREVHHYNATAVSGERRAIARREFIAIVLRAGAYAATIAVFGRVPAFGQADTCTGKHDEMYPLTVESTGTTKAEAIAEYWQLVQGECDDWCEEPFNSCPGGTACVQAGTPVASKPECEKPFSIWQCEGTLKQCTCVCMRCNGKHRPPGAPTPNDGLDYVSEAGANQGAARAAIAASVKVNCDKVCAKFKDCTAPKKCKRTGFATTKPKFWPVSDGMRGSTRIKFCKCNCQ